MSWISSLSRLSQHQQRTLGCRSRSLRSVLAGCLMLTMWGAQAAQAVTFKVTKTADTADGACNADCSLREAITAANDLEGDDIITFSAATFGSGSHTINLLSELPDLSTNIDLRGPGAERLTVRRNVSANFAIFRVDRGGDIYFDLLPTVSISGLTISNGSDRGGIYNFRSVVTVQNCTISGNSAAGNGGGIFNDGMVTVQNSTISGNSAYDGGGIYNVSNRTLTVQNSTISGNSAYDGGGIFNDGTVAVQNSTINGNSANVGGGIFDHGALTVQNSTISGNAGAENGYGGGIYSSGGALTVRNSIVAGNTAGYGPNLDSFDFAPTIRTSITDGTAAAAGLEVDSSGKPLLKSNGGPTKTIALLPGSPAINTGTATGAPATDQRGYGRTGVSDTGAFEFDGVPPLAYRVDALIKRSSEADTAYALNDVYQLTPHDAQIEKQSISSGGTAIYQVKVQNDTTTARTFSVRASESAAAGWTVIYKQGATDITTAMKSSRGYKTATLAPDASEIITILMTPGADAAASKSTTLRVFLGGADKATRDAVKAVTSKSASLSSGEAL